MDGELTETLYDWPEHGDSLKAVTTTTAANGTSTTAHGLHVSSVRNLGMDAVAYMHDKIGLHRVANTNTSRPAVSLHLYSPPIDVCQTFCESTGEARKSGKCVFFSVGGRRTATCNAGLGEMCKE